MRSILITILLIIITIDTCEGIRGLKMSKFINNLNKAINNACNKQAYILTNNTEIYNCLRYNISNKCNHLDNFIILGLYVWIKIIMKFLVELLLQLLFG